MKPIYFIFLALFFCISCSDDDMPIVEESSPFWGEITALKNGESWNASVYAAINTTHGTEDWLHIIVRLFDENEILRETMALVKIPLIPNTHSVFPDIYEDDGKAGALYSIYAVDVPLADYLPLESDSTSFITLEEYDEASGEVKGTFDITFVADWKSSLVAEEPDTIRFTNGVFHTRVWEQ